MKRSGIANGSRRFGVTIIMSAAVLGAMALAAALAANKKNKPAIYSSTDAEQGTVFCANLIYGYNKTSVCFADEFLAQLRKDSNIRTSRRFRPVKLDSQELYEYPFAVMTGEGSFSLTDKQRRNLRDYLTRGGFLISSAGCSSSEWDVSFRAELKRMFPKTPLVSLPMSHAIFHCVYDIDRLDTKEKTTVVLKALMYEDRVVLIYSPEGLNDTDNAGPGCCCCGGNEILNAKYLNANILAYALTH